MFTKGGKIEAFQHPLLRVRRKWEEHYQNSMETVQRVVSTDACTMRRDRLMFKIQIRTFFLDEASQLEQFLSWDSTFHVVNAQL